MQSELQQQERQYETRQYQERQYLERHMRSANSESASGGSADSGSSHRSCWRRGGLRSRRFWGNCPGYIGCVFDGLFHRGLGTCDPYRWQQGLRVVQLVHLLFQSHTGGGLGRVVNRTDGNGTHTKDDAQTQNELDGVGIELLRLLLLTLAFAMFVIFHNV